MKNIACIFGCLLLCFGAVSCGGDDNPAPDGGTTGPTVPEIPDFEFAVSCENRIYSVGEPVDFTITGNAQEIHFYSGEMGSRYDYRDEGENVEVTKAAVSFKSQISNLNDLESARRRWVSISYDFDGQRQNRQSIEAATWIDLTDRFALATSNTAVESGEVDLTEYAADGSFYFAIGMHHSARSARGTTAAKSPSYRVNAFKFYGITEYGETVNFIDGNNLNANSRFVAYDFQASDNLGYSTVGPNQLRLQNTDNTEMFGEHDIWMISSLLKCDAIPSDPESGVVLKYSFQSDLPSYSYTFDQAGVYTAVFVGFDLVKGEQVEQAMTVTVQ